LLRRAQLVVGFPFFLSIFTANAAGWIFCWVHGDNRIMGTVSTAAFIAAAPTNTGCCHCWRELCGARWLWVDLTMSAMLLLPETAMWTISAAPWFVHPSTGRSASGLLPLRRYLRYQCQWHNRP
jgi:hypothetical protein